MSDDDHKVSRMATRVISDGNGGLKLKEPFIETLRKWSSPVLLGLLAWIGKGAVTELISLHDGQLRLEVKIAHIAEDANTASAAATEAFTAASESLLQSERNSKAISDHDDWSKRKTKEVEDAIEAIKKTKGAR